MAGSTALAVAGGHLVSSWEGDALAEDWQIVISHFPPEYNAPRLAD